ncbi:hypothetical protein H0H93_004058, partial [Arthromyces matolae]
KGRVEKLRGGAGVGGVQVPEDEDWEVEMVSAVVEALDREIDSEEVAHDTQVAPLLEVLQARDVLKRKLEKGGCGENGVGKKDVR